MKNRPRFKIWDKEKKKWYRPIWRASEGKLDELLLSPDGRLSKWCMIDGEAVLMDESHFPNRYRVDLIKEKQ